MLLTTTRIGRDVLRNIKVYPVIRETHLRVENDIGRKVREGLVQASVRMRRERRNLCQRWRCWSGPRGAKALWEDTNWDSRGSWATQNAKDDDDDDDNDDKIVEVRPLFHPSYPILSHAGDLLYTNITLTHPLRYMAWLSDFSGSQTLRVPWVQYYACQPRRAYQEWLACDISTIC